MDARMPTLDGDSIEQMSSEQLREEQETYQQMFAKEFELIMGAG